MSSYMTKGQKLLNRVLKKFERPINLIIVKKENVPTSKRSQDAETNKYVIKGVVIPQQGDRNATHNNDVFYETIEVHIRLFFVDQLDLKREYEMYIEWTRNKQTTIYKVASFEWIEDSFLKVMATETQAYVS